MGEGGLDPHYFLEDMTWLEIDHYIQGLRRRSREGWLMMREHMWFILTALGVDKKSPQDLREFSWETEALKEEREAQMKATEATIDRMLEEAREHNRRIDAKNGHIG